MKDGTEGIDLSGYETRGNIVIGYPREPCRKKRPGFFYTLCANVRAWMEGKMNEKIGEGFGERYKPTEIRIRNRDIPKLTRVLYAMQDVSATERKRMWQQDRLWNMTARLTGMPGGGGDPKGYDANFADICEIEERYDRELAEYLKELKEAEEIINGIRIPNLRTFVTMKYVLGMRRHEILRELNLKRWEYNEMSARVERAESMQEVEWAEKYVVTG